jgi:hypothetical protein
VGVGSSRQVATAAVDELARQRRERALKVRGRRTGRLALHHTGAVRSVYCIDGKARSTKRNSTRLAAWQSPLAGHSAALVSGGPVHRAVPRPKTKKNTPYTGPDEDKHQSLGELGHQSDDSSRTGSRRRWWHVGRASRVQETRLSPFCSFLHGPIGEPS